MLKLDLQRYGSNDLSQATAKGTYVLILFLKQDKKILFNRQRSSYPVLFPAGYYAYVGSAHGPGGLESRINRHLTSDNKSQWHIDYLRKEAVVMEVWVDDHEKKQEKVWADALVLMKGSHPVENFGNMDDRKSRTHLCYFKTRPSIQSFKRVVTKIDVTS